MRLTPFRFMISKEEIEERYYYENGHLKNRRNLGSRARKGMRMGFKRPDGYIVTRVGGRNCREHRLIWILFNGHIPKGMQIDHINHVRDDNRIENLRLVDHDGNCRNQSKRADRDLPLGIYRCNDASGYKAQINCNGKTVHLGYAKTVDELLPLVEEKRIALGFHPNHGKSLQ